MKKLIVLAASVCLLSGCVRFKTPTQEIEIDVTPLIEKPVAE